MPDMPTGTGDWSAWIITTLLAVVSTMVGTVIFLAKLIEGKYRAEIADLKNSFATLKNETAEAYNKLYIETVKCREDREQLAVKAARLEARIEKVETNQSVP